MGYRRQLERREPKSGPLRGAKHMQMKQTRDIQKVGVYLHLLWNINDLLTGIGSIGTIIWLLSTPPTPYNEVLGVDKNASQCEIQKAFHKLSLKYHPDKNNDKHAQVKFSEINNAYRNLSDEEKRKNYELYGDEKGNLSFESGGFGNLGYGSNNFNFGGQSSQH